MTFTVAEVRNEAEWEAFLTKTSPVSLFQSWAWGSVQERIGRRVYRIGLYSGGRLKGVLQVFRVAARRGSFLHVRHGPILSDLGQNSWQFVADYLRNLGKENRVRFIRISPLVPVRFEEVVQNTGFRPSPIHAMDAELCWVLPLEKTLSDLLQDMRKTTRYEIRRSEKLGVSVSATTDPKALTGFFRLYAQTTRRHGFVGHEGIREEFDVFAKRQSAYLYQASHDGELLAAAIILDYAHQAIYHHGASKSTKVPAAYALQWQAIQDAKARGRTVYNFWGIAPDGVPGHPWSGISAFKRGFGGQEERFMHAQDLPITSSYWITYLIESMRKRLKGY